MLDAPVGKRCGVLLSVILLGSAQKGNIAGECPEINLYVFRIMAESIPDWREHSEVGSVKRTL